MTIRRIKDKGLRVSNLAATQLQWLEQIPAHADPAGSPPADQRLFPDPVREPDTTQADGVNEDWRDHVIPELRTDFARQIDVVGDDLKQVRSTSGKDGPRYDFLIPFDHVESWYGALNQARLVMQERYHFPELDTADAVLRLLGSPNIRVYLTSRFYVEIQGVLIDLVMDR